MLLELGPLSVYFSFADGALGYHCGECGYRCCRGAGFGATASELVQLGQRYPTLPMFLQPRTDPQQPIFNLVNFTPRCFFLRDDGLCRVEVDHGRELKPYVCRAFPANQLQRTGALLVAELNFLCPLRPFRPGDVPVRHADVARDLLASIEVPTQQPSAPAELFPEALFVHETYLRDLAIDDDLLGRLALADMLAPRWDKPVRTPPPPFIASHRAYLATLRRQMIVLLGLGETLDADHPRHARELGLMLPRLRLALLRSRPEGASIDALLPQLGRRFVALSVYLELIASLGGEVTLGLVDQAFRQGQVFCEILSMVDRVPLLEPTDNRELKMWKTQEAAMQRFLRFLEEENPHQRLSLAEVLDAIGVDDPVERAQLCQSFTRESLPRFRFEAKT